jgi:uncharacterized membrane protein YphA (DoxX/SURF4 family)
VRAAPACHLILFRSAEARFMSSRRLLLWLRLLTGIGFMYQGVTHIYGMHELSALFGANPGWQSWPFVGGMRPLELTLWIAFLEFGMGVFLFGGLLTRFLGGLGAILAGFQLLALGMAGGPLNIFLFAAALTVCLKGGGGGTMDSALGAMQRKSIERQRERDAEGARLKAEKAAAKALAQEQAAAEAGAKQ